MLIEFSKYQGAGNDFIILDNRKGIYSVLEKKNIEFLCNRHFGIGADGLMLLNKSDRFDFSMRYYNSDGKEGTMCGNGGRCISKFAQDLAMINFETTFEAIDGVHYSKFLKNNLISLDMIDVNNIIKEENALIINTGSLHYVIFKKTINNIEFINEARAIRYNEKYSDDGINVNFVEVNKNEIFSRTYERGVENETLSCGTGAVAIAIAYLVNHPVKEKISHNIQLHTLGGNLNVELQTADYKNFTKIKLVGPANFVFKGKIII